MIDPLNVVPIAPIQQRTIGDMATDALRVALLSGRYRPGERLVEKDLAGVVMIDLDRKSCPKRPPPRDSKRCFRGMSDPF